MILAFDMQSTGVHHAQFNSALLQIVAHAAPGQAIRIHASHSHVMELKTDPWLTDNVAVEFCDVAISPHYPTKPQVVSVRRFWREFATIRKALRRVPPGECCLLVLLTATSTAIFAASLLARDTTRKVGVLVCLHGEIEVLPGWRSRNPLVRRFDLRAILERRPKVPLRFLVLEPHIRTELLNIVPQARDVVAVVPIPAIASEISTRPDITLQDPVRVGLIGQATEAKGVSPFLETARILKQEFGKRIEFYLIGRVFPGDDIARFAILDAPVSSERLPRDAYRELLSRLHFAFLSLQIEYYRFAASAAVMDAITWLKPVIATPVPMMSDLFNRFGDIGYLCDTTADMQDALRSVLTQLDAAHYARQVAALRVARDAHLPTALAETLRPILQTLLPEILQFKP